VRDVVEEVKTSRDLQTRPFHSLLSPFLREGQEEDDEGLAGGGGGAAAAMEAATTVGKRTGVENTSLVTAASNASLRSPPAQIARGGPSFSGATRGRA